MAAMASIGTFAPTCPGANALDGRYRSPWTRKRGTSAVEAGSAFKAGEMYHLATRAKRTSEEVNCTPMRVVGLIRHHLSREVVWGSFRAKPVERLLAIDEPLRREDGRALKRLCPRLRE